MTDWLIIKSKNRKKRGQLLQPLALDHRPVPLKHKLSSINLSDEIPNPSLDIPNLLDILRDETFYRDVVKCLTDIAGDFNSLNVLGLGSFSVSMSARLQLALAMGIRRDFLSLDAPYSDIYDPIMNHQDLEACPSLGFFPLGEDPLLLSELNKFVAENEGKDEKQQEDCCQIKRIIYYMPHCPYQVYNRLLWRHWGNGLADIIIIGNSFMSYSTRRIDNNIGDCLVLLRSHLKERPLWQDDFAYKSNRPELASLEMAFNDLSAMWFPRENLSTPEGRHVLSQRPSLVEMEQAAAKDSELL